MVVAKKNSKTPQYHPHVDDYCKTLVLFLARKMNLREFMTSERNVPIAVFRKHENKTWHICTGDGIRGGPQEDGAWLNQTIWGETCLYSEVYIFRKTE